jgi:transposase-like protein
MQNGTSAATDKNLSQVIRIDEAQIQQHLGEMVRSSVEETLNGMLDAEADRLCNAGRYEHTEARTDQRAGHYRRKLQTRVGEVELKVPKLRHPSFRSGTGSRAGAATGIESTPRSSACSGSARN